MSEDKQDPEKTEKELSDRESAVAKKLGMKPEDINSLKGEKEMPPAFKFLDKYFPEADETGSKSRYKEHTMPTNLTIIKLFPEIYPELNDGRFDMDSVLDTWVKSFEKRVTSVEGQSREEFKEILKALLTGVRHSEDEDSGGRGLMEDLFTKPNGGEEE